MSTWDCLRVQVPVRLLLLPFFVLLGAALLTGSLYLFTQDWLQTIVLGDYVGWYYIPYLGTAIVFLADIVFYRGVLSTAIVGTVLSAFAAVLSCL